MVNFVKKPGTTIGDVVRALPFDQERALMVATTEITNMFAEAEEINGKKLKKEYPDVLVIKTWFTCNDSFVCPICAALADKEVEIDDEFARGISRPAAHDGCRCWMSTTTRIGGRKPKRRRLFGR
jgi:hypothetical protein